MIRIGAGGIADIYTKERTASAMIVECGEPLVNIADYSESIAIELEETSAAFQRIGPGVCLVRERVAKMLTAAQSRLPRGLMLKVVDGYRPISAQRAVYAQVMEEFRSMHSEWDGNRLENETDKWVANPDTLPPHTTGGAIDLTIACDSGELDMGTPINSTGSGSETMSPGIIGEAASNRRILIGTLAGVGFVNNPREWWHWSYGDRRWAIAMERTAIYGSVEQPILI